MAFGIAILLLHTPITSHPLKPILRKVMEVFQPGAIVMQCGEEDVDGEVTDQEIGARCRGANHPWHG
jgi:hypothetical protein